MKKRLIAPMFALLAVVMLLVPSTTTAGTINVAAAANFAAPAQELLAAYNATVDHTLHINFTFDSTGNLARTIRDESYPYDLFFAANTDMPDTLYDDGLVAAPVPYARLALVAWTNKNVTDPATAIDTPAGRVNLAYGCIAVPDPMLAPIGAAAKEALIILGLWTVNNDWSDQWIDAAIIQPINTCPSIGQAYKAVTDDGASYAFLAKPQVFYNGVWAGSAWEVPTSYYSPIIQTACLVYQNGTTNSDAEDFLNWVLTDIQYARPIFWKYGF